MTQREPPEYADLMNAALELYQALKTMAPMCYACDDYAVEFGWDSEINNIIYACPKHIGKYHLDMVNPNMNYIVDALKRWESL